METHHFSLPRVAGWVPSRFQQAPDQQLREFIRRRAFPCVGAKAALNGGGLRIENGGDIMNQVRNRELLAALYDFIDAARDAESLVSFAVIFPESPLLTESQFETVLWRRLQALHDLDHAYGFRYDSAVDADPASPEFALSFGGAAFFAVGLHPKASRASRRFIFPTIVLNLHRQFETLRHDGTYKKMRRSILQRDNRICGTPNPMLKPHGHGSAAPQYSGRQVDAGWRCPFQPRGPAR